MGIPYAFQYYYNKYNCANELMIDFYQLAHLNINYLFFDYNSLIHPCAQQILSANHDKYIVIDDIEERTNVIEKDIIQHCLNYTRFVINQVFQGRVITRYIYIMIDGVAPRSKMNQQRERRYKSEFFKVKDGVLWDSNKITPGTGFMDKLKCELEQFSRQIKEEMFDISCEISDANEVGEGEHKIMKIISNILDSNSRVCIYGLDADLIMLSLMNKNYEKIILIRDNSFNHNLSDDKRVIDYLNIKQLRRYICDDIIGLLEKYKNVRKENLDLDNIIYDYVLLCFLLGNDFLEHLPSLVIRKNGIDIIMKSYVNAWKGTNHISGIYLVNKIKLNNQYELANAINLHYLRDIMYHLKNNETYFFKNFKLDTLVMSEKNQLEKMTENENILIYMDDFVKFNQDNYKTRYYMYYNIMCNEINDVCLNYIEGLYWVLGYYSGHIHNNWTWFYRYHNSPFCSDLFEFLKKMPVITKIRETTIYTPLKQLYMVLPKTSLKTILKEMGYTINYIEYTLFTNDKFYPDKICVDLYNKKYVWQSKIFMENMDEMILDLFIK